jgi:hypothetical protein
MASKIDHFSWGKRLFAASLTFCFATLAAAQQQENSLLLREISRAYAAAANDRGQNPKAPICVDPQISSSAFGCTIVMAARNGLVLVGNNEDRNHPKTIVSLLPASSDYYGRVVFGYDDMPVQGGMNDQGLFIDGNSLAPTGWKPDPGKPTFRGSVMMVLLGTCATCEDVKAFFEKSNVPALEQARLPVADRSGASMVVEYGQGRVQFVRSRTWYQIATNFVMSNISDGRYPCWRYRAADKILSEAKELSLDLIRNVLEKTHQEGGSLTVYSNIYDLKKGLIHIYNLRNFKEVVVMNLAEELKKGQRRLELPSLFKHAAGNSPITNSWPNKKEGARS